MILIRSCFRDVNLKKENGEDERGVDETCILSQPRKGGGAIPRDEKSR